MGYIGSHLDNHFKGFFWLALGFLFVSGSIANIVSLSFITFFKVHTHTYAHSHTHALE